MPPLRPVPRGAPRLVNQVDLMKDAYLRFRAGATPRSAPLDWMHATYLRPMGSKVPQIYGGSYDEPLQPPASAA